MHIRATYTRRWSHGHTRVHRSRRRGRARKNGSKKRERIVGARRWRRLAVGVEEADGRGGSYTVDLCVLFFSLVLVVRELLRQKSVCRRIAPMVASVAISLLPLSLFLVLSRSRSLGTTARAHTHTYVTVYVLSRVRVYLWLSLSFYSPSPRLYRKVPVSRRRSSRAHSRYVVAVSCIVVYLSDVAAAVVVAVVVVVVVFVVIAFVIAVILVIAVTLPSSRNVQPLIASCKQITSVATLIRISKKTNRVCPADECK